MNKNRITPAVPNQDSQDMDDLRIVEYLNLATLPEPLQKMLSQAATYNSILRKAAEHEQVSHNRVKEMQVIPCPQLSVLLTGTFSQYRHLVPSIENGYFSRLLPLIVRDTRPFNSLYVEAAAPTEPVSRQVGQQLAKLCTQLYCNPEQEWSLTSAQKSRLAAHLSTEYKALISMLGENFHSAVVRMAIQIERIAMILSALRLCSQRCSAEQASTIHGRLFCSDADYTTAELIGSKLILHMAAAYRLINGDTTELVPAVQTNCQKQLLFTSLQPEFAHQSLVESAKAHGIPKSTVLRWTTQWVDDGKLIRISHGIYKKVG